MPKMDELAKMMDDIRRYIDSYPDISAADAEYDAAELVARLRLAWTYATGNDVLTVPPLRYADMS